MKRLIIFSILILSLLGIWFCLSRRFATNPGRYDVRIVDKAGRPISGFEVKLQLGEGNKQLLTTDSAGCIRKLPYPGVEKIHFSKDGVTLSSPWFSSIMKWPIEITWPELPVIENSNDSAIKVRQQSNKKGRFSAVPIFSPWREYESRTARSDGNGVMRFAPDFYPPGFAGYIVEDTESGWQLKIYTKMIDGTMELDWPLPTLSTNAIQ